MIMKSNLTVIEHPLVTKDISVIRNINTQQEEFRNAVSRISTIMAARIMETALLNKITVATPLELTDGYELKEEIILVPILRAGLGMVNGFLSLLPSARVGHVGIQRNENTLEPQVYYSKSPVNLPNALVILLDPMLATGGSASSALSYLKSKGAVNFRFACLVAAPEGVKTISEAHPDVPIYAAALDRCLNERGYILPGLGDAGDRTFGTL